MQTKEIHFKPLPDIDTIHDLKRASRKVGESEVHAIWMEWPTLQEACRQMSKYTAGLLFPGEKKPLLVETLDSAVSAYKSSKIGGEDAVGQFVYAASEKMTALLYKEVVMNDAHGWRTWNPLTSRLGDYLSQPGIVEVKICGDAGDEMIESAEARLIISSRIFSIHELVLSGLIPRAVAS